jgi:F-type H+-transporting ATPase subunit b
MIRSWLTAGVAILVLSLGARADEPGGEKDKVEQKDKGEHKDKGEPKDKGGHEPHEPTKDDPFAGTLDLSVWSIAVFLILFAVLYRYAWGPISKSLDDREGAIRQAVEEAKLAREEAEKMRAQLQREMQQAQDQVRQTIEEGRRDAARVAEETVAKARAEIAADRERLRRELDLARDQALKEIWNQAADVGTRLASKALGRQITLDDQQRLIEESLNELGKAAGPAAANLAKRN